MGSRDAEAMPGRSGDYDAREMVRGSMIGKKLFGGSGLPTGAGACSLRHCPGSGTRLRTLVCGRRRPVGQIMRLGQEQTAVKILLIAAC